MAVKQAGQPLTARLACYNGAVQQTYIRFWFETLRVGKELARGYFCTVTPP